jgi:hypothetical protein
VQAARSTAWPELLDALEERTRQLAGALDRHEPDPAVTEVELVAAGPLPAELALRVRVLLAETERLQSVLVRRTGPQARARAAYAGH